MTVSHPQNCDLPLRTDWDPLPSAGDMTGLDIEGTCKIEPPLLTQCQHIATCRLWSGHIQGASMHLMSLACSVLARLFGGGTVPLGYLMVPLGCG